MNAVKPRTMSKAQREVIERLAATAQPVTIFVTHTSKSEGPCRMIAVPPGCSVSIETITPADAKRLLSTSANFRKTRPHHVRRITHLMNTGKYYAGADGGITIDDQGNVIDGFHRLNAVVATDTPVQFVVVRGAPTHWAKVKDRGLKRNAGDYLTAAGVAHGGNKAAAAALCLAWQAGKLYDATAVSTVADDESKIDEVMAFDELYSAGDSISDRIRGAFGVSSSGYAAAATLIALATSVDKANEWFGCVINPIGMEENDPRLALMRYIVRNGAKGKAVKDRSGHLHATLYAWNTWCGNGKLQLLKQQPRESKHRELGVILGPDGKPALHPEWVLRSEPT